MRPHLQLLWPRQSLCVRPLSLSLERPFLNNALFRRHITSKEKPLPQADIKTSGPNETQLPHVSEEAAATGKIMGEGGPEIEEQGTPIQEVFRIIICFIVALTGQ